MNTFEITIQRKTDDVWPVVVEQNRAGTFLPVRSDGTFELDLVKLTSLVIPRDYGTMLGKTLFFDAVRDAFVRALAESDDYLCVLLFVEAPDLQAWRWERLCAPLDNHWDFLALSQRTPFSLYLPSITDRRFPLIGRRDLRALVVAASPQGLEQYRLSPFDVATTVSSVRTALGEIPCDVLATVEGAPGSSTLDALCEQITAEPYTLLHIVCHGRFIHENGETVLYLAQANNQVDPVSGTRLLERLARLRGMRGLPHLAFLATCESASPEAEGALGGLAQRLVRELGMPAVIAMTERVSATTAQALAESFYCRLRVHGEVDLALVEACSGLAEHSDITVPALYSRLGGRPLFSDALDRDLTNNEISFGLARLEELLKERAPVLRQPFDIQAATLRGTLGSDETALSKVARVDRERALIEINKMCEEVLDLSFNALALEQDPPPYDGRCPFRGLYPFHTEDREFFFGRESLIERLQQQLADYPFLAVLGPSGSGKSSLVLAGLIPALQKKELDLQIAYMTPGDEPMDQLDASLAKVSTQPSVLIVDQFEEVFTLCTDENKRRTFLDHLLTLVRHQRVVIAMRADFWGECASHRALKEEMQAHQELISPMDAEGLRRAMEQQAAKVGLRFEADLCNTILDDVEDEPGAMPLLQHALLELWKRRHGRWLRAEEYRAIGGVQRAIARTADTVYEDLSSPEQEQVQDIFIRLTRLDEDVVQGEERHDTRQRVWLEELVPDGSEPIATKALVKRLADARLVVTSVNEVTGREEVEVAHEALIRYWPRLRVWLDEDRDSLRLRKGIREAAREWETGKRDEGLLVHRGARLHDAEVLSRQSKSKYALNKLERVYIDSCVALQARAARRRRNVTVLVAVISLALVAVLVGGLVVALVQQAQLLRSLPVSVTNFNNDGPGSLRDAIKHAIPGGAITFARDLKGTITLTSGELKITQNLAISGPGESILSISGGNNSRVFDVSNSAIVTISNLTIENGLKASSNNDLGEGGGITIDSNTTLVLTNTFISNNRAFNGGGIENSGTLILTNSTVSDNKAKNLGGGIEDRGSLTLVNSTIFGNTSQGVDGGGISANFQSSVSFNSSTIAANATAGAGGGIEIDGQLSLTNSTVSGNTASDGGGISNRGGGSIDLYYCTIYGNSAKTGGGITNMSRNDVVNGQGVFMGASILAGNHADKGPDILGDLTLLSLPSLIQNPSGAHITFGSNPLETGLADHSIIGKSPDVGPLGNNGGPTQTHALLPGSPAIDQMSSDITTCGVDIGVYTDQRGVKRPQGKGCDIGAYEYVPPK